MLQRQSEVTVVSTRTACKGAKLSSFFVNIDLHSWDSHISYLPASSEQQVSIKDREGWAMALKDLELGSRLVRGLSRPIRGRSRKIVAD